MVKRMSKRLAATGLTLSLVACLGLFNAAKAAPTITPPPGVNIQEVATSPDSLKYIATWSPVKDAQGAADGYLVRVSTTKAANWVINHTIPTLKDSFTIAKPLIGDSVMILVQVYSVRRGLTSTAAAAANWKYKRPDVAPPAPDSLKVDSSSVVIGVTIKPDSATVYAETDSRTPHAVQLCAFVTTLDGYTQPADSSAATCAATYGPSFQNFRSASFRGVGVGPFMREALSRLHITVVG